MIHRIAICLAALVLATAVPTPAQTVTGRVIDADSGAPIDGAILKGLGTTGDVLAGSLSGAGGRFILNPDGGAALSVLSVERIGYQTELFDLQRFPDPGAVELRLASSAITLDGITVTARSYCDAGFGTAGGEQVIWDEARKSLEITALSQGVAAARYETQDFQRDLRPDDYAILRENSSRRIVESLQPYSSLSVEQMTDQGWIEGTPREGMEIFGPSAELLLSDQFAAQHCFRAEVRDDAILLHFVPNDQRNRLPEIEGTMVLDPQTAELTRIDFSYVRVPELGRSSHAGGTIRFFGAPNGLRVVRDWALRGPEMTLVVSLGPSGLQGRDWRVEQVNERGGRVLSVTTEQGRVDLPQDGLLDREWAEGAFESEPLVQSALLLRRADELMIRNNDAIPYRITRIELSDCRNTVLRCGSYPVDVEIAPGETRTVFRIMRERADEAARYLWSFSSEPIAE